MRMNDLENLSEPPDFAAIMEDTRAISFDMPSEALTCSLLRTLAASRPGGNLLEPGSGTGLATSWIPDGMDTAARLTTIDSDPKLIQILSNHLGDDSRLTIICGGAEDFLLSTEIQQFDLIFADAWPGKYVLLDESLAALNSGGIYVIDDMLPQPNWPDGHENNVANLVEVLENRDDFRITKLSWGSGLIVCVKC